MYETRQQAALQQDENKRGETKAVNTRGAGGLGKPQAAPVNNRRALGDIGNVVARSNATKDSQNVEKKITIPVVDRPITRSFVAQLANNQKDLLKQAATDIDSVTDNIEESQAVASRDVSARIKALPNPKNPRVPAARKGRTLTAILTARSEAASGGFKKPTEEPITDIDAKDVGNQLAVVDYVEDIYSFYRKTEVQSCVPPNYMSKQSEINEKMRAVLIDWLIEVHFKFKLMPETLFLTTNLIDRYLALHPIERKNLQLVGMTAMLIASKYEEIWAPEIKDFIIISDNAYTRSQILDMEKHMLNTLKFNMCIPTPYVFLVRFLKAAASDQQMNMLAFYFVELCLVDYAMLKFTPSMLAASAVYLARNTLKSGEEARWNGTLKWHSGYKELDIIECASSMVGLHSTAGVGNVTVVHRKYSQSKYNSVALLSPPGIIKAPTDSSSFSNGDGGHSSSK